MTQVIVPEMLTINTALIYRIYCGGSGQAMTIRKGDLADGAPLVQELFVGQRHQQFKLTALTGMDEGYYRIMAVHSNKCLEVQNGSLDDGVRIVQMPPDPIRDSQKWRPIPVHGNRFQLQVKHSGKMAVVQGNLYTQGSLVVQSESVHAWKQEWILVPFDAQSEHP